MGKIGIIGGSGLYKIGGFEGLKEVAVDTPFGKPSDKFITGTLEGKDCAFLPRHGRGHTILPSELNYRANIYAMKSLGVDAIISISAVGSLKKELKPLDMVVVDQFIDRTNQARPTTFFGDGIVAHVAFANPVCPGIAKVLYETGKEARATMHKRGTYINMEGPMFSTKAESHLYRKWGVDIIGMTNMPEARLAREAGICYATMAMVTDYDCWHEDEGIESVTLEMILENFNKNAAKAKEIIKSAVKAMPADRDCGCSSALEHAIVTMPEDIPAKRKKELDIIIGKYI